MHPILLSKIPKDARLRGFYYFRKSSHIISFAHSYLTLPVGEFAFVLNYEPNIYSESDHIH